MCPLFFVKRVKLWYRNPKALLHGQVGKLGSHSSFFPLGFCPSLLRSNPLFSFLFPPSSILFLPNSSTIPYLNLSQLLLSLPCNERKSGESWDRFWTQQEAPPTMSAILQAALLLTKSLYITMSHLSAWRISLRPFFTIQILIYPPPWQRNSRSETEWLLFAWCFYPILWEFKEAKSTYFRVCVLYITYSQTFQDLTNNIQLFYVIVKLSEFEK